MILPDLYTQQSEIFKKISEKVKDGRLLEVRCIDGDTVFFLHSFITDCDGKLIKTNKRISETYVANYLKSNSNKTFEEIFGRHPEKKMRTKIECPPCPECPECPEPDEVSNSEEVVIKSKKPRNQKYLRGDELTLQTSADELHGYYYIVELSEIIASHLPSQNFAINPKYPKDCQERHYEREAQLQVNVGKRAARLQPKFLITEAPSSEDGAPVTNKDFIVLGGNSRAMMLELAVKKHKAQFKEYKDFLRKRCEIFGFSKTDFDTFKEPVLVRVIDADMSKCSYYSWTLNTSTKNETNILDRAVALSKELKPETIESLVAVIELVDVDSFSEMMQNTQVTRKIIDTLRLAGIINDSNSGKFLDKSGLFTSEGKILVEDMLIALILPDKQLIETAKNYSSKLIRGLPLLLKIKAFPDEWNFIPMIAEVIKFENNRRTSNMNKKDYLAQTKAFSREPTEEEIYLWNLLDKSIIEFRKSLLRYIAQAESQIGNEGAMFKIDTVSPKQSMKNHLADKKFTVPNNKKKKLNKLYKLFYNDPIVKFFRTL